MKEFLKRIFLFLATLFLAVEISVRVIPVFNDLFLEKIDPFFIFSDKTRNHAQIFIGSSRVGALIMPEIMNSRLSKSNIYCINAGRGMSTGMIHYLALQHLEKKSLLESTAVFIEAPGGLCSYYDDINGYWVDDRNIHLIIPYLNNKTLRKFWKYSDNKISVKTAVTADYYLYSYRILSYTKELLTKNSFIDLVKKVLKKYKNNNENNELSERGGIKTDSLSIIRARSLAAENANLEIKNQQLIKLTDWNKSILKDIHTLLKRNHAELVLFPMPLSSVQSQIYSTPTARENILTFSKFLADNEIKYLDLDISDYTDDDFPDFWHISEQKAEEFTNQLIDTLKVIYKLP